MFDCIKYNKTRQTADTTLEYRNMKIVSVTPAITYYYYCYGFFVFFIALVSISWGLKTKANAAFHPIIIIFIIINVSL